MFELTFVMKEKMSRKIAITSDVNRMEIQRRAGVGGLDKYSSIAAIFDVMEIMIGAMGGGPMLDWYGSSWIFCDSTRAGPIFPGIQLYAVVTTLTGQRSSPCVALCRSDEIKVAVEMTQNLRFD